MTSGNFQDIDLVIKCNLFAHSCTQYNSFGHSCTQCNSFGHSCTVISCSRLTVDCLSKQRARYET